MLVVLQVSNWKVSQTVLVHTVLWWFKRIQSRSLLVVGHFIHQWFLAVCVLLGLSCIMDGPLGCWGRSFWHQMSWIFHLLLPQRCWIEILLLSGLLFFVLTYPGLLILLLPTVILHRSGSSFWGRYFQQKCAYFTCRTFGTLFDAMKFIVFVSFINSCSPLIIRPNVLAADFWHVYLVRSFVII